MKSTSMLAALAMGLMALNVTFADDAPPLPVPDAAGGEAIVGPGVPTSEPIELYACVKVEDRDNIHPCAVPMIIAIADPCNPCCCRYIQICVPPCGCPQIKVKKHSREVEYDYGSYEVEIKSKNGILYVDYDD